MAGEPFPAPPSPSPRRAPAEAEWNAAIEDYIERVNRRIGETTPVPRQPVGIYDMAIARRLVTEDLILAFANAVGDANPLWRSSDYAAGSCWGGMIAPPLFESCISEMPGTPAPPQIPGWSLYNAGNLRRYLRPMHPGDVIRAEDTWLGASEKTRPGHPYRLFLQLAERTYLNQRDEVVCTMLGRTLCTATPPALLEGGDRGGAVDRFAGRKRRRYSADELAGVHAGYDDELSGRSRRGGETRYVEDVAEGEPIPGVVKGPYDVSDAVAFFGAALGYSAAFALKWQGIQSDLGRCHVDPETGEHHHIADWHLQDSIARTAGLPYALAFGTHLETMLSHAVTNWMGDAGILRSFDSRLQAPLFHGDLSRTSGTVRRRFTEEGEDLVELALEATNQDGVVHSSATAVVRLPSRRARGDAA